MNQLYIKFPTNEKIYQITSDIDTVKPVEGKKILMDSGQVIECAEIIKIKKNDSEQPSKYEFFDGKAIRLATDDDIKKLTIIKEKAKEFIPFCREKIAKHNLKMKLFDVDLSFDEKKLTLFFGADGRIDFRALAMDLIKSLKKIIRLQQVGVRDQAKLCGGYGCCGRQFCCQKFLGTSENITLDTAKIQDLSSGAGKILGVCGKLMCCLNFEAKEYIRIRKKLPRIGTILKTKSGKATVVAHNIFQESVIVQMEKDGKKVEVKV